MEILGLVEAPTWILVVFSLLLGLYFYYRRYFFYVDRCGFTGPFPLPLIGTAYTLRGKGILEFELELHKKYKDKGIFRTFFFHTPFISVLDPELMKEILVKRFNDFPNRLVFDVNTPEFERGMTNLQNDHWKHIRSIASPTFTSGKLKNMMRLVKSAADSFQHVMAEKVAKGENVNLKDAAGAYTMDVIASTMFGIQVDSQKDPDDPFVTNAKKIFNISLGNWKFILILLFPQLGPVMKKFGFYLFEKDLVDFFVGITEQVMKERKEGKEKYVDFMQLMVNEEVGDDAIDRETSLPTGTKWKWSSKGILRKEILANAVIFFVAGYDTTATTLAILSYNLALHPEIQDKVIAEIDQEIGDNEVTYESVQRLTYLEMALSESLRMYPPALRFDRVANHDVTINGITFPKGVSVGFPVYAIHHDPEIWPDPFKYDPERFTAEAKATRNPYHYMPFGSGQRACIGMRLALMEIKVALATFYAKNKFVKCDQTPEKLEFKKIGILQFKNPVLVGVESRK